MICRTLMEERSGRNRELRFEDICSVLGVKRVQLENMLYETFGVSGDDIISCLGSRKLRIED